MDRYKLTSTLLAALLAATMLASLAAPAVAAGDGDSGGFDWTIDELRNGDQPSSTNPGTRMVTESGNNIGTWYLRNYENKPWVDPSCEVSDETSWTYVDPDTTVRRNHVCLRTTRLGAPQRNMTVRVVSWDREQVDGGNGSGSSYVASNVSTDIVVVGLDENYDWNRIKLPTHNEERRVTLLADEPWLDGPVRWQFKHKSSPTTQEAGIETQGDLMMFLLKFVATTFLLMAVTGVVAWRARERAKASPQYGMDTYAILGAIVAVLLVLFWWNGLASLIVSLPKVLAFVLAFTVAVVIIEGGDDDVKEALFFRPDTTDAQTPSGLDGAKDLLTGDFSEERVIKNPRHEGYSMAPSGILAWLSRALGGATPLRGSAENETEIELDEGPWDLLFIVGDDNPGEPPVRYDRENIDWWQLPEIGSPLEAFDVVLNAAILGAAALSLGAAAGYVLLENPLVGASSGVGLAALAGTARVNQGYAEMDPAPIHYRSAFGTLIFWNKDIELGDELDELRERFVELAGARKDEVDETAAGLGIGYMKGRLGAKGEEDIISQVLQGNDTGVEGVQEIEGATDAGEQHTDGNGAVAPTQSDEEDEDDV